ncbi:MAG: hypothetical protein D6732_05725 [Methanobacteriota archaeon]|nr:MAG: hypothetical protein D6732_05725 [Euryarchaeota archaeon]
MFTNPVDLVWSLFRYNLSNLEEAEKDFERALLLEKERGNGRSIPEHCIIVQNLYYRDIVRFGDQIERYLTYFDRQQMKILIYDEFFRDLDVSYREVLEFLEVHPSQPVSKERINEGEKYLTHVGVRRFLGKHPRLKLLMERTLPLSVCKKIKATLAKIKGGNPPHLRQMNPETRQQLKEEFRPQIQKLADLIYKDLSHWYQ